MATVYEIKIKAVSPFVNYNEAWLTARLELFLEELKFENTEIEVKRNKNHNP